MPKLSLILPTYNERENLAPVVNRIGAALRAIPVKWEILVVDDGSPDGTAHTARELAREFPIRVLSRNTRKGLARSVADGFRTGSGDFFLVMDADMSHPPERIPAMWNQIAQESCDLVIGSRYVEGGGTRDWTVLRRLTSKISKLLVRPLTQVNDPLSGFFLVRKTVVNNGYLRPIGFKILLEILAKGDYRTVREVPITFEERLHGTSKLSHRVMWEYLVQVVRLYLEKAVSAFKQKKRSGRAKAEHHTPLLVRRIESDETE